jgi:HlyD family secretion protein
MLQRVVLAALSLLVLTACNARLGAPTAETPPAEPVTVAVTRGDVVQTVTAPGRLVGAREMLLSLPVGGSLVELNARPGLVVRVGDVLARPDDAPYQAALGRAQLALRQAEAEHAHQMDELMLAAEAGQAQVDQARAQFSPLTAAELELQSAHEAEQRALNEYNKALNRPWEPGDVVESYRLEYVAAQRRREIAESELTAAQNRQWAAGEEVAARQADLDRLESGLAYQQAQGVDPLLLLAVREAEADLAAAVLTAPFDGVILDVFVRPGETVAPGQSLILLSDPSAVEVETEVIEEDLPLLKIGQAVEIYFDAQPDTGVWGRVDRIVPRRIPGEDRPLYTVYLALDGPPLPGVLPGMTADASIIIDSRTGVLHLPRALVRGGGDSATVEVWQAGERVSLPVVAGLRGDVYTEILSGLEEGDEVVAE